MGPRLSVSQITTCPTSSWTTCGCMPPRAWLNRPGRGSSARRRRRGAGSPEGRPRARASAVRDPVDGHRRCCGPEICRATRRTAGRSSGSPRSTRPPSSSSPARHRDTSSTAGARSRRGRAARADPALEPYEREGGIDWSIVHSAPRRLVDPRRRDPLPSRPVRRLVPLNTDTLFEDDRRARRPLPAAHVRLAMTARVDARFPAKASPASRPSWARLTPPAGTASTTSRSSPTTARSAPSWLARTGRCRRRRRSHAQSPRSSGAGP